MVQLTDIDLIVPPIHERDEARSLLTGINLTLSERRVVMIGANGSSKSSLLRLLNGMRQPTFGAVSVKSHDVAEEPRKIRQFVGLIFIDPLTQLLMFTPIENLTLSLGHLPRKERTGRAQQIPDERDLGHLAHRSTYDLSGGEHQTVALASALTVRPEVIVADEPATLLNLRNKLVLRRAPAELEQQVIYSTYDMDVATDADRVIVTEEGQVTADGEPGEIIAQYKRAMGVTGRTFT